MQNRYPLIPYMEFVHKETQQGGVVARFECSSLVISLDVSPSLDYMVCECMDGMLQLWSLHTGRLVWTRPVVVRSNTTATLSADKYVTNVSSGGILFHRSVVFHPTRECVLSGTLHQAYTIDGDLKPLFPKVTVDSQFVRFLATRPRL